MLLGACQTQNVESNECPDKYLMVGATCCFDENSNGICDNDEAVASGGGEQIIFDKTFQIEGQGGGAMLVWEQTEYGYDGKLLFEVQSDKPLTIAVSDSMDARSAGGLGGIYATQGILRDTFEIDQLNKYQVLYLYWDSSESTEMSVKVTKDV